MGHSNKDDDVAIRVSHVKKDFYLPHEKRSRSFKSAIISAFKKKDKGANTQHALKDISFEIKKGDFFGIVGRNGSGKSTLLKIIAQIYQPTKGKVEHFGKIVPFIELGVGFNPELSGRENIYLNGALLGFTREEIDAKYDDIVGFAELEDFMDQKLKNYSSGMQVRLAFSIAIQADGDILLLDEVLAVGDEAFQRKCNNYFKQLKDNNKTVILVTHSMENVRMYCDRSILIKRGKILIDGTPDEVADEYSRDNLIIDTKQQETAVSQRPYLSARIKSDVILSGRDTLVVEAEYKACDNKPVYMKFAPLAESGQSLMTANAKVLYNKTTSDTDKHIAQYKLPMKDFNYGNLSVVVLLADAETGVNIADYGYNGELSFRVTGSGPGGSMKNKGEIRYIK